MVVSVIVPLLDDTAAATALVAQTLPDPRAEVILVDGGSDAALDRLAGQRADLRLVRTPPGRARQMNAGAAAARAEWLLFLHADSILPAGWLDAFEHLSPQMSGGWFRFALDDAAWQARVIEHGTRWRVRVFGLPYGDQGLFVRRDLFRELGGYPDLPLMEDVAFARALQRHGRVIELPLALRTSSRRWRRDGWWRRSASNLALVTLYFAGVSPARLAAWYRRETPNSHNPTPKRPI
jgi:rSAM/selenodomain-associated transferase 2